jgi:hypothetical protein
MIKNLYFNLFFQKYNDKSIVNKDKIILNIRIV